MSDIRRPALRYHGGKWMLADWILSHFPEHRIYVEPFGGAASVLLRKERSYAEIYNDLDREVVNFFRVMRTRGQDLLDAIRLTPFARDEFDLAFDQADDPIENARRLLIRSFMGFGSTGVYGHKTGFRANSNRSGSTPAQGWANLATAHEALIDRLSAVVIENRPAEAVMATHDGPDTLHYVDPPYVHSTRSQGNRHCSKGYRHEMSDEAHGALLTFLCGLEGAVVLSGYSSALYDDALSDWTRIDRRALADGARERTECLWLNPKAAQARSSVMPDMFEGVTV